MLLALGLVIANSSQAPSGNEQPFPATINRNSAISAEFAFCLIKIVSRIVPKPSDHTGKVCPERRAVAFLFW